MDSTDWHFTVVLEYIEAVTMLEGKLERMLLYHVPLTNELIAKIHEACKRCPTTCLPTEYLFSLRKYVNCLQQELDDIEYGYLSSGRDPILEALESAFTVGHETFKKFFVAREDLAYEL